MQRNIMMCLGIKSAGIRCYFCVVEIKFLQLVSIMEYMRDKE